MCLKTASEPQTEEALRGLGEEVSLELSQRETGHVAAVAPGQMVREGGHQPDACRWPILIVWWEGSRDWDRRNTVR